MSMNYLDNDFSLNICLFRPQYSADDVVSQRNDATLQRDDGKLENHQRNYCLLTQGILGSEILRAPFELLPLLTIKSGINSFIR